MGPNSKLILADVCWPRRDTGLFFARRSVKNRGGIEAHILFGAVNPVAVDVAPVARLTTIADGFVGGLSMVPASHHSFGKELLYGSRP